MFWRKKYDFYLAGSMRGRKDFNKPLFALTAKLLREQGFTVWSPSEHKSYLQLSFAQVIALDLNMVINRCKKIALIPGWRCSQGANGEVFAAFLCGKEAVEIILRENEKTFDFGPVDLSDYRLPYGEENARSFNPHECASLGSFD